jgi:DNA helicase-2/ATP-dependent DNA helicase PcrA
MEHAPFEICSTTSSALNARAEGGSDSRDASRAFSISPARVDGEVLPPPDTAGGRPALGKKLLLVFGPPGTGKTTRLLDLLASELEAGTPPDRAAFVTFTKAARAEAKGRVLAELDVAEDDLPWFRTVHSAAYRLLGLRGHQVMGIARWFATRYGYDLTNLAHTDQDDDPMAPPKRTADDLLRAVIEWAKNRRLTIDAALGRCPINAPATDARLFAQRLAAFQEEHGLLGFSDMLEEVVARDLRPEVSVAFIDEAQDLSPLQIAVVETWFRDCDRVYVGGDDDQAIFSFQGADPSWLLSLNTRSTAVEILRRSFRVPGRIHALARRIIGQNRMRVAKPYEPRDDAGEIAVLRPEEVLPAVGDATSVFILARNRVFLGPWAERLLQADEAFASDRRAALSPLDDEKVRRALAAGVRLREGKSIEAHDLVSLLLFVPSRGAGLLPHGVKKRAERAEGELTRKELAGAWGLGRLLTILDVKGPAHVLLRLTSKDRDYLERLLARHDNRVPDPRFRLLTIHGAKGREADVVVVIPDMTRASYAEYIQCGPEGEEAENRVAYVAVTRARQRLILVEPTTRRSYPYERFLADVPRRPLP